MRYVRRDSSGKVDAHFANPNPQATELLSEDHPDILEYKDRQKPVPYIGVKTLLERVVALELRLTKLEGKGP